MTTVTVIIVFCVLVITLMALYIPLIHIRLSNKILKRLESIEANTRK